MSSFVCTNLTPTVAVHSHMLPHLTLPWTAHAATLDAAFVCMCYLHLLMSQHLMLSFVCAYFTLTVAFYCKCPNTNVVVCLHMFHTYFCRSFAHAATLDAAFGCTCCHTWCRLRLHLLPHLMLPTFVNVLTINAVVRLHMFHTYCCRSFAHAATLDAAFICTRCHTWCYLWRHVLPTFVNVPTLMSSFVCTCFTLTVAFHCKCPNTSVVVCLHMFHTFCCRHSHTLPHLMLTFIRTRCHTWCYLWLHMLPHLMLPTFVNVPTTNVAVHSHMLPHLMLPSFAHAATLHVAFICTCCCRNSTLVLHSAICLLFCKRCWLWKTLNNTRTFCACNVA